VRGAAALRWGGDSAILLTGLTPGTFLIEASLSPPVPDDVRWAQGRSMVALAIDVGKIVSRQVAARAGVGTTPSE
jgi:hypothetical protein